MLLWFNSERLTNGTEISKTGDSAITKTFPKETLQIELTVHTIDGCVSAPVSKFLEITPKPSTSIAVNDACYGDPVPLLATSLTPDIPIRQWYWLDGDGTVDSTAKV